MAIHNTAIIDKSAEIDATAEVGPYCVIGPSVRLGPRTRLISHVHIAEHTTLGADNVIHPFAILGGPPQDLKFKGEPSKLVIGDANVIRECVTMNRGTAHGHMESRIGSRCLIMAYAHIAHDCTLGNNVILANSVGLAGHVTIGDNVNFAGLAGIHQFCEVGRNVFVGGGAMVAQSIPPFCIAVGDRAELAGLNVIGLKRAGWPREKLHMLRDAFRRIFLSDEPRKAALEKVEAELAPQVPEIAEFCSFIRRAGKRGVCSGRRAPRLADLPPDE
ncbi:MAG: acyl-ACP--UDP-N-acetylglucosamine O-acyltransferase [Deltaproteobacteria bacterium]|nr:acyl-ACP--UDP-N-acetylglucosamine O-acyltransferase [Deltaproteobacteria bacterium]